MQCETYTDDSRCVAGEGKESTKSRSSRISWPASRTFADRSKKKRKHQWKRINVAFVCVTCSSPIFAGTKKLHDQTWHVFPLEVLLWPAANTKNFPWDQLINFQVIILTNLTDLIKQLDLIQFKMCGSTATVSSWCSLWVMNWDKSSPSSCFDNAHVFLSTNCIRFGMIYRRHCKM